MGLTISRSIIQSHGGRFGPAQRQARSYVLFHSAERAYDLKINCMTGINKGGRSSGVAGKSILNRAHRTQAASSSSNVTYVLGHILEI